MVQLEFILQVGQQSRMIQGLMITKLYGPHWKTSIMHRFHDAKNEDEKCTITFMKRESGPKNKENSSVL